MDLGSFRLSPTKPLEICAPDGRPLDIPTGELDADGNRIYTRVVFNCHHINEASVQRIAMEQRQKRLNDVTPRKRVRVDAEELQDDATELLAHCIKSWENVAIDGVRLECTLQNKLRILNDPAFSYIREQVDAFVNNANEFLGNSLKS